MTNHLVVPGVYLDTASAHDAEYARLLRLVLDTGTWAENRTGVRTRKVFGASARFSMSAGFPLLTSKRMHTRSILHELIWFLSGSTSIQYLRDNNVTIWDEWDKKGDGELGPVYGAQWRAWPSVRDPGMGIDQIANAVGTLRSDPESRRIIVSAWNPDDVPHMALATCHVLFHLNTVKLSADERLDLARGAGATFVGQGAASEAEKHAFVDGIYIEPRVPRFRLDLLLYQRSCDLFLGVPFNIASYAALLHMFAQAANMVPGDFIHFYGDLHLYENHLDQARLQLDRVENGPHYPSPTFSLDPSVHEMQDFRFEHMAVHGYQSHPAIKGDVAV